MGKISSIFGIIRKFTPEIQGNVLAVLKNNRQLLKQEYGFLKLPEILSSQGKIKFLENGLLNKEESIREIITNTLLKQLPKVNHIEFEKFSNLYFSAIATLEQKIAPSAIKLFENNFAFKKAKILELFEQNPEFKELARKMKKENSPEKFLDLMMNWQAELSKAVNTKYMKMVTYKNGKLKSFVPIESQQLAYNARIKSGEIQLELQKILCPPSTDERVLAIEKILKNRYGMEYVNLRNLEEATKALESVKIATKNGIPLPKNYIITPYIRGNGLNQINANNEHTVYINSAVKEMEDFITSQLPKSGNKDLDESMKILREYINLNKLSTSNPLQLHMHEIIHDEMSMMQIMNEKPFLEKEREIIKDISIYANSSATERISREEVRTEIRAKQVLEYLKEKELGVLNILS